MRDLITFFGAFLLASACGGAMDEDVHRMGSRDDIPTERTSDDDVPDVVEADEVEEEFGSIEGGEPSPALNPLPEDSSVVEEAPVDEELAQESTLESEEEPFIGGVIGSIVSGSPQPESDIIVPVIDEIGRGWIATRPGLVGFALRVDEGSDPAKLVGATVCQMNENGVTADFTEIGVSYTSHRHLSSAGTEATADGCWLLGPTGDDLILDFDDLRGGSMRVTGTPAIPRPSSELGDDLPRSGDTPQLLLVDMTLESLVDGSRAVVPGDILGNPMTLRAGEITVLQDSIPEVPLVDGAELDIHRVELHARNTVSLKHLEVFLEKKGEFEVTDFRVYRTDMYYMVRDEIPSDQIVVNVFVDQARGALSDVPSDASGAAIYLEWLQEEVVAPTFSHYVVTAQTVGVESGNSLGTSYWQSLNQRTMTGYLGPMIEGAFGLREELDGPQFQTPILWSDRSEGSAHGEMSCDWINDFGIIFTVLDDPMITELVAP